MNLEIGKHYEVRIVKYLRKGVIVRFVDDPGYTAFIHLSQISSDFVKDVSTFVRLGDVYTAEAVADEKFGTQLSLIHLGLKSVYEPAGEPPANPRPKPAQPKCTIHVDYAKDDDKTVYINQKVQKEEPVDKMDKMIKDANASLADKIKSSRRTKHKPNGRK